MKQQDYHNNNEKDFNVQSLMGMALNKYKTLVELDQWEAPTANSQINALTAQLSTLEKKKSPAATKKAAGPSLETKKKKVASDFGKNNKKWAWKVKAPKKEESKTKKVDGKTYHWCHKHKAWTLHTPADCCKGVDMSSNNKLRTAEHESKCTKSSSNICCSSQMPL